MPSGFCVRLHGTGGIAEVRDMNNFERWVVYHPWQAMFAFMAVVLLVAGFLVEGMTFLKFLVGSAQ